MTGRHQNFTDDFKREAVRLSLGVDMTHKCQGHKKSESRNGT